ncbi:MAG: methyltransferase domain-containing protein [Akkermansiaceae bacterium]|nr:methyltransferase domain-containing protein [Armatimonadota bacterium]
MKIQDAYTNWSATYDADRNLTRDLDEIATRQTLESGRFRSILELGCGTGKNTMFLAQIGETVHAVDFSKGMLARAEQKVRFENVTFAVADLTKKWEYPDGSADLVVCNLVLEHIQDLDFIFAEVERVLTAGGRFFLCELHPFRQYGGTKANFQRGDETTEIAAFTHHLSDFTDAADEQSLALRSLKEWWHEEDKREIPRLVSFLFEKH